MVFCNHFRLKRVFSTKNVELCSSHNTYALENTDDDKQANIYLCELHQTWQVFRGSGSGGTVKSYQRSIIDHNCLHGK